MRSLLIGIALTLSGVSQLVGQENTKEWWVHIDTQTHIETDPKALYKHRVRFITNVFECPSPCDMAKEQAIGTQFWEHLGNKYPNELMKLRFHLYASEEQGYLPFMTFPYDPNNPTTVSEYAKQKNQQGWEVIYISDFRFEPNKYPTYEAAIAGRSSSEYRRALSIVVGAAEPAPAPAKPASVP